MKLRSSGPSFRGAGTCPLQLPGDCKPFRPHSGEKVGICHGSRLVLCKPLFLFRSVTHTLCFLSTWFPFILVVRMRLDTPSGTFVRAWRGLAALTASLADPLKVTGKDVRWHRLKSQRTYGLISIRVHRSCLRELVIGPFGHMPSLNKPQWPPPRDHVAQRVLGGLSRAGTSQGGGSCRAGQTSRCGVHLLPSKLFPTPLLDGRQMEIGDFARLESCLGPLTPR